MADQSQIESTTDGFAVHDPFGETNLFSTEDEAKADIEIAILEDRRWQAAKMLVETAIQEHSKMCSIDRETAKYWIKSAVGL
jgi:hypothetical protein